MFEPSKRRLSDDRGFTLIELIVVILIIGILAAIALPNFIGQRARGYDADAKSNVTNTVTSVEACYTDSQDYNKCTTSTQLNDGGAIAFGTAKGQVSIDVSDPNGYKITGYSKSGSTFTVEKKPGNWAVLHTCTLAAGYGNAGCPNGSW